MRQVTKTVSLQLPKWSIVCVKEMTGANSIWVVSGWMLVTGKAKSCRDFLAMPPNPLNWSPVATESFTHACVTKPPKTLKAQRLESFRTAVTWGFLEDGGKVQKLSAPPRPLRIGNKPITSVPARVL